MESTFWDRVEQSGHRVPDDRPLAELTSELTTMLGDTDPARRDRIACTTLAAWVTSGVYDDLLSGLGDGMASGLAVGLGEQGTDTVFRRSFSALILGKCLERDNARHLVPQDTVLGWGDRLAGWFVAEQDLRGYVPGKGWAHAVAHGADALGALAESPALGPPELPVLLDVVAERLLGTAGRPLLYGEGDRLALATMRLLRRDLVGPDVLEAWVHRLGDATGPLTASDDEPLPASYNVQGYLRALHLQLALAPSPPACRSDMLLAVIEQLKRTNPDHLGQPVPA
jgi:hypothetical protein